jgi:membrane protease YdiL (CAAX protease family)
MKEGEKRLNIIFVFGIYFIWILITKYLGYLNRLYDFRSINIWILPAIRMTLMLLIPYLYIKFYEQQSFASGFNFRFQKIWKNILWAVIFFLATGIVVYAYETFIVKSFVKEGVEASSGISHETVKPFMERLFEYLYIVYEGIVEVLVFVGFFLDRLARKWGWTAAIIISNIGFALWHFGYWRQGWLNGSLMIFLTFIFGVGTSLCYLKTRNSLSPVLLHTMFDSPNAIRILLGMM